MVIIGANQDTLFARLAKMIGTDWATDPRFATHDARGDNQLELDELISVWTRAHTMKEVLRLCEAPSHLHHQDHRCCLLQPNSFLLSRDHKTLLRRCPSYI